MGSNPILSAIHIKRKPFPKGNGFFALFLLGIIAWSSLQLDSALWRVLYKTSPVIAIYREGEV